MKLIFAVLASTFLVSSAGVSDNYTDGIDQDSLVDDDGNVKASPTGDIEDFIPEEPVEVELTEEQKKKMEERKERYSERIKEDDFETEHRDSRDVRSQEDFDALSDSFQVND